MKLKKLNVRGFSHHFVMAFVIVGTAIGGVSYLVASHAQVPYENSYSCPTQPQISTSTAASSPTCTKYVQTVVGVTADGSFGPITKLAVQKFQIANHVANSCLSASPTSCDGIVGPNTWVKLVALNAAKIAAAQASPAKAPLAVAPKPAPAPITLTSAELAAKTAACVESIGTGYIYNVSFKRCVVAVRPTSCPTGTVLNTINVATTKYYFCNDKPTTKVTAPVTQVTPVTPVTTTASPTTREECQKIYGSTFFYDEDRCVSFMKPVCPTGTVLATTSAGNASNSLYYCDKAAATAVPKPAPTATIKPLVTCTYFVGVNETKTIKSTEETFCDNVHNNQLSWKDCPVVVNGKTTTAMHSVAYCATHKPAAKKDAAPTAKPVSDKQSPAPVTEQSCLTSRPVLRQGSTGICVKYVQHRLGISADGQFGGGTYSSVKTYQESKGLENDGIVAGCVWTSFNGGRRTEGCKAQVSTNTSTSSGSSNSSQGSQAQLFSCRYRIPGAPRNLPTDEAYTTSLKTAAQCRSLGGSTISSSVSGSNQNANSGVKSPAKPVYGDCKILNRGVFGAFGWVGDTKTLGYLTKDECTHKKDYRSWKAYPPAAI